MEPISLAVSSNNGFLQETTGLLTPRPSTPKKAPAHAFQPGNQ